MKQIYAQAFSVDTHITIYCVGEKSTILDLCQFFDMRDGNRFIHDMDAFISRIISGHVHAQAKAKGINWRFLAHHFNRQMARNHLLIRGEQFIEALVLVDPVGIIRLLHIPEDMAQIIIQESIWNQWFDIDKEMLLSKAGEAY